MTQYEIENELGQPGARELLETGTLCRLAYNGSDGYPRMIPVGFWWDGTAVDPDRHWGGLGPAGGVTGMGLPR
jgi:hypothetical protein